MLRTSTARYRLAAILWGVGTTLVVWPVEGIGVIVLAVAVTVTIIGAIAERDERMAEVIRLAFWAGTLEGSSDGKCPRDAIGTIPGRREAPLREEIHEGL